MARTIEISDEIEEEFEEIIESVDLEGLELEKKVIALMELGRERIETQPPMLPDRHIDSLFALKTVLRLRHGLDDIDHDALLHASTVVALSDPDEVAAELQRDSN